MTCNIFIIGKTGVGKSSLLNYLAGNIPLAKAGGAEKINGITQGFNHYNISFYGIDCNLIDSEGYEILKFDEWVSMLNKEINKVLKSTNADEAFPVIIYCINGAGGRVEPEDIIIIKELEGMNIGVVPLITKADKCSYEDLYKMGDVIYNEYKEVVPVILSSDKNNQLSDDRLSLLSGIINAWAITLKNRFSNYVFDKNMTKLYEWQEEIHQWILSQKVGFLGFNEKKILKELNLKIEERIESLNKNINNRVQNALLIINHLYEQFGKLENSNGVLEKLKNISVTITGEKDFDKNAVIADVGIGLLAIHIPILIIPIAIGKAIESKDNLNKIYKEFRKYFKEIIDSINEQRKSIEAFINEI